MRRGLVLLTTMAALTGCLSSDLRSNGGQAAGPAAPSAILRALDGGLVGRSGLSGLAQPEMARALEAEYRALEYGSAGAPVPWQGASGAVGGEVVPGQPYRVGSQDCRPYSHSIRDGSGSRMMRGTACRNADGSWTPLS